MEKIYSLESLGINEEKDLGKIDDIFVDRFHKSIEFKDNHYHVEIPWYDDILKSVPSNHQIALATIYRISKKLTDQNLLTEYLDVFDQYERDGIIEPIQVDIKDYNNYIWIPHRPVIKTTEQAKTRLRPVFNCSLKNGDLPSLNQACYPGIDLMSSLFNLLLLFRTNKHILTADVAKAFLQIRLKLESDRNKFCFFIIKDGRIRTYRYTSILFGLAVSPYILGAVIKFHASQYTPDISTNVLLNNFYVDDLVVTSSSYKEMEDIYKNTTTRMREGGFDLCAWGTNNNTLKTLIDREGKLSNSNSTNSKVLGIKFDSSQDTIQLQEIDFGPVVTKRDLLAAISKIFDPLSLYAPVTVKGRLLMRQTWADKLNWDDPISSELLSQWDKLYSDILLLKNISFKRMCFDTSDSELSLNIFCDASMQCYSFSVYVTGNNTSPYILMSKSKIAPVKGRTLPQLELLSVFLGLKCLPQILSSFNGVKFKTIRLFSDSQITLSWVINKNKKFKQVFVKNRVQDIKSIINSVGEKYNLNITLHYVRSEENPADLLTRGLTYKEFINKLPLWEKGPNWLSLNTIYWPKCDFGQSTISTVGLTLTTVQNSVEPPVINISKYSDLNKLHRIAQLVFKFLAIKFNLDYDPDIKARLYCIKIMQEEAFPLELKFLRGNKTPSESNPVPNLVQKLNLFIDEQGLLRSKGRIERSNYYNYEIINPIVMSRQHHLTTLYIRDAHHSCKHLGIQATLTKLRLKGFWVTSSRTAIKNVLAECVTCKKYNAFAYQYPRFTNYSKDQVNLYRPFQHVGVDFTSHWFVKTKNNTTTKYYILIYTCLNTRAIYLDLIPDMSAVSFVQSLKRFICRFGVVDTIYSDNAKSFKLGCNIIENFSVSEDGQAFLRKQQIKHRCIPLYSPWVGSMWERLIRVVKDCLHKAMGRTHYDYFDFITILSEVTDAINSRPLTYTTSENDIVPLTPNHFLKPLARTTLVLDDGASESADILVGSTNREKLIKTISVTLKKFEEFRTRWYHEYLLSLRETYRDLYQSKWDNVIKIGDIVQIKSPVYSRPFWQIGVVKNLISGNDGKTRFVDIQTADKQINTHSIKNLYPLELSITHNSPTTNTASTSEEDININTTTGTQPATSPVPDIQISETPSSARPLRQSAQGARRLFVQLGEEDLIN